MRRPSGTRCSAVVGINGAALGIKRVRKKGAKEVLQFSKPEAI
jgi:hypothetical protein